MIFDQQADFQGPILIMSDRMFSSVPYLSQIIGEPFIVRETIDICGTGGTTERITGSVNAEELSHCP